MTSANHSPPDGSKLQEICRCIGADYDNARYLLAKGLLPKGVEAQPGKGNHRVFDSSQSFQLAIILKLRAAGVTVEFAKEVAQWVKFVQGKSVNESWEWTFAPFAGKLQTNEAWYLEVGDARFIRVVTSANPSKAGLDFPAWTDMRKRKEVQDAHPAIILRVDVSRIAQLLMGMKKSE